MCILIFAAKELSFEQRMGHDIQVLYDDSKNVSENSGPGKIFPGGLSCIFHGVVVPALFTCIKKGSITSDILTAAFKRLDDLKFTAAHQTSNLSPYSKHMTPVSKSHSYDISTSPLIDGSFVLDCLMAHTNGKLVIRRSRMVVTKLSGIEKKIS